MIFEFDEYDLPKTVVCKFCEHNRGFLARLGLKLCMLRLKKKRKIMRVGNYEIEGCEIICRRLKNANT